MVEGPTIVGYRLCIAWRILPAITATSPKTSLLFFYQPNDDAMVEGVQTRTGPDNPLRNAKTTSGEHATAKIAKHRTLET